MYQEQWGNTPIDDLKGHITGGAEIESDIWLLIAEYYADTDDEPYMIQFITVDISKISSGDLAISVDNSDMLEFFYAGEDYNTAFDRIHGE